MVKKSSGKLVEVKAMAKVEEGLFAVVGCFFFFFYYYYYYYYRALAR